MSTLNMQEIDLFQIAYVSYFPFVRHHTAVTSGQTSLHVANYQGCFLGVFFFILVTN